MGGRVMALRMYVQRLAIAPYAVLGDACLLSFPPLRGHDIVLGFPRRALPHLLRHIATRDPRPRGSLFLVEQPDAFIAVAQVSRKCRASVCACVCKTL